MYTFETGLWTTVDDYPFLGPSGDYFIGYEMLYIPEMSSYFVIGGYSRGTVSTFAKFKDGAWSEVGKLTTDRYVSFCSFLFSPLNLV